jgi:hypothetical protein
MGSAVDWHLTLASSSLIIAGRAPGGADSALLRRSAGGAGVVVNLPPGRREVSSGCFGSSRIRRDLDRAVAATLTWEVSMDPALWIELIVFVVLLGFSGFFSSTETSLFSLSSYQIDQMRASQESAHRA